MQAIDYVKTYDGMVYVHLLDGSFIEFPASAFPRLKDATWEQLENYEISRMGIHWPDLDEDLSLNGLIKVYGIKSKE